MLWKEKNTFGLNLKYSLYVIQDEQIWLSSPMHYLDQIKR